MTNAMPIGERIYWSLPRPLRLAIARGFYQGGAPFRRIRNLAQSFSSSAYRVSGERAGETVELMYAGGSEGAHHFAQLLGGDGALPESLGSASVRWLRGEWPTELHDPDLVVFELDRCFASVARKAGMMVLPQWVGFRLALDRSGEYHAPIEGNKSLRADLRSLRRGDLRIEKTQNPVALEVFYNEMYAPHLEARHGAAAKRSSRWWMRRLMEAGVLIQVFRGDEFVGGDLVTRRGQVVYAIIMGARLDSNGLLPPGVSAALYKSVIEWAQEQNCREVDFGNCRPYLSDGLVRFKKKWGMRAGLSCHTDRILAVKVRKRHSGVRKFLEENPCFLLEPNGLACGLYDNTPAAPDPARLQQLVSDALTVGIEKYYVAAPAGVDPVVAEMVSHALSVNVGGIVF